MPKRKKPAVTCVAQYTKWPETEPASISIYTATYPSGDPVYIEVRSWSSGSIRARIIDVEDLEREPYRREVDLVHRLLREHESCGRRYVSDVLEKPVLGIEIVTQRTIERLARRHPEGARLTRHNDGDCDCNGGD